MTIGRTEPFGRLAARGAALIFVAISILQIALAFGAPLGAYVWGGGSAVLSPAMRAGSAAATVYLWLAAWIMLARAGDVGRWVSAGPLYWFNWILALQMALNTAGNLAGKSLIEKFGMGSISLIGCLLCLAAALLLPRRPRGFRSSGLRR